MKTIYLITAIISTVLLSSCHFDFEIGEKGSGNVTTEERTVSEDFNKIKAERGLDVYLTEGSENKITVEADDNLHSIIETEINAGKLTITTSENIGRASAKKVYVTYKQIDEIDVSSGADVRVNSVLKSENLNLEASSGSDLEAEIFAKEVYAKTSSGATIKVSGKASNLMAKASSGSDIKAKDLHVASCNADASSGAGIVVNVQDRLETEASSGGDITYFGNPTDVSKDKSSSGSIKKM